MTDQEHESEFQANALSEEQIRAAQDQWEKDEMRKMNGTLGPMGPLEYRPPSETPPIVYYVKTYGIGLIPDPFTPRQSQNEVSLQVGNCIIELDADTARVLAQQIYHLVGPPT